MHMGHTYFLYTYKLKILVDHFKSMSKLKLNSLCANKHFKPLNISSLVLLVDTFNIL